jgi:hypothetical protein
MSALVWRVIMDIYNIMFASSVIVQTSLTWKVFQRTEIVCKYCDIICALYIYLYWKMVMRFDCLEVAWKINRSWFCNKHCFSNSWHPDQIVVTHGIKHFYILFALCKRGIMMNSLQMSCSSWVHCSYSLSAHTTVQVWVLSLFFFFSHVNELITR